MFLNCKIRKFLGIVVIWRCLPVQKTIVGATLRGSIGSHNISWSLRITNLGYWNIESLNSFYTSRYKQSAEYKLAIPPPSPTPPPKVGSKHILNSLKKNLPNHITLCTVLLKLAFHSSNQPLWIQRRHSVTQTVTFISCFQFIHSIMFSHL